MSNFPCPNKVDCPGVDDPIANLTSEGYDRRRFYHIIHPSGNQWLGQCCGFVCESTESQEEADLCAENMAALYALGYCAPVVQPEGDVACNPLIDPDDVPPPPPDDPDCPDCVPVQGRYYWNSAQCCHVDCPELVGFEFYNCVAANHYVANSQILADRMAYSAACRDARVHRFCLSTDSVGFCVNVDGTVLLDITGGVEPFDWGVTPTLLPVGLVLEPLDVGWRSMRITGTCATAGVYSVPVQIQDALGNYLIGTLRISVMEISPATLSDITPGVAYSQNFTVTGMLPGLTAYWTVDSGTLPGGLTLETNGLLHGTPDGTGLPANVTIGVTGI